MLRAVVVGSPAFPCILGRAALNADAYRFGLYDSMLDDESVDAVAHDLFLFTQEQPALWPTEFSTFLTCYLAPYPADEAQFEGYLWAFLQKLHDRDAPHFAWDPATSSDPDHPNFSFSFAGRSFFVIGMHPHASRYSRRFAYPVIVFNSHDQFERLRREGRFASTQTVIRNNDRQLQGSINPSLTNYGDDSEAKQYSGRLVERNWRCPFRPRTQD
jgi:FPC/CPF motif-containing protein YcgG